MMMASSQLILQIFQGCDYVHYLLETIFYSTDSDIEIKRGINCGYIENVMLGGASLLKGQY